MAAKMRWDSLTNPRNLVTAYVSEDGNWLVRPVLETEGVKVVGWEVVDLSGGNGTFRTPQAAWQHVESKLIQEEQ
jgi:hypothetical protein